MADHPLRPATRRRLGEPLPHQLADRPQAPPRAMAFMKRPPFPISTGVVTGTCGISPGFPGLSPAQGQIAYVLRTRPPVGSWVQAPMSSRDLHVLSTPPAFVLSQDQTLHIEKLALASLFERPGLSCFHELLGIIRCVTFEPSPQGHSASQIIGPTRTNTSIFKKLCGARSLGAQDGAPCSLRPFPAAARRSPLASGGP